MAGGKIQILICPCQVPATGKLVGVVPGDQGTILTSVIAHLNHDSNMTPENETNEPFVGNLPLSPGS